ncbi:phage holin [Escherichia coli]|uniref:phage holin n=1 Tax=Escherichia coli TaxID=562 RepID=UPI00352E7710
MWRLVLTVLKVPRWSFTKLRRKVGVLGSLLFGLLTYLTNLYFKIKEDKRKAARGE